ncbi:hypothetical protein OKW30_002478 [Paraburkholderia sp. Clong3]|uniref:hypothetical protein n=1 Tax=Paraburkholderia sp. Clong3 TaxID=2991061 RepID=UPI003D23F1E1
MSAAGNSDLNQFFKHLLMGLRLARLSKNRHSDGANHGDHESFNERFHEPWEQGGRNASASAASPKLSQLQTTSVGKGDLDFSRSTAQTDSRSTS